MRLRRCFLSALTALPLLAVGRLCAAQAIPPTPPAPAPPTLAGSLALARPPDTGVFLAVDAAKVSLPKEVGAPDAGASVAEVAAAYGRLAQDFGGVTAVAPPTMAVLNTQPVAASPFAGLPSGQALKLLLATLTDGQWKILTGERGLGPGDLTDDSQRALFEDVLPPAPWKVIPTALIGTVHRQGDDRDLTAERPQARLRLRLNVALDVPALGGKDTVFVATPPPMGGGQTYHFLMSFGPGVPQMAGIPIRAEVPNVPKDGQLDLDQKALQVRVPLAGLHTVGDLVFRVGGLAHLELYPDAHYEKKALTVTGQAPSARAADLLRALAFDLTATYRQVGSAFVLTDDIQGVGTRRQLLAEFGKDADAQRKAVLERAGAALARHFLLDLPPSNSALALSDDERKRVEQNRKNHIFGMVYMKLPFRALSTGQRQAIRGSEGSNGDGEPLSPDLTAQVTIKAQPLLEWLPPSLDGPVIGDAIEDLPLGFRAQGAAPPPASPGVAAKPLPSWPALMRAVPLRALHVHPRTAAQAGADIVAARTLGLNQVWVDAFSGGEPHEAALDGALAAAKGTGVRVFAVLDLLDWGPKAKADMADLTILGETSAQAATREQDRDAQIAADKGEAPPARAAPDVMVSLFAPTVRQTLLSLVTRLSGKPGLAGMVWRETDPAGYTLLPGSVYDDRPALGYTLAARLAFLRQSHVDPVDLATSQILLMGTDTSLPLYEGGRYDDHLYAPLADQWRKARSDADVALLRDLYAAAQAGTAGRAILVQNRGNHVFDRDGWYGTWDAMEKSLPTFMDPFDKAPEGQSAYSWDALAQARPQSRMVLTRLPLDGLLFPNDVNAKVGRDVQKIAEQRAAKPKMAWDGFVLESAQEALPELPSTPSSPAEHGPGSLGKRGTEK